jgi:hypothetical protein
MLVFLWQFGLLYGPSEYFVAILYINVHLVYTYFPVLVCRTKKILATLQKWHFCFAFVWDWHIIALNHWFLCWVGGWKLLSVMELRLTTTRNCPGRTRQSERSGQSRRATNFLTTTATTTPSRAKATGRRACKWPLRHWSICMIECAFCPNSSRVSVWAIRTKVVLIVWRSNKTFAPPEKPLGDTTLEKQVAIELGIEASD